MERPIVVNSMLCFIHNFRNHSQIEYLAKSYFSKCVCDVARQTLLEILGQRNESEDDSPAGLEIDIEELLRLFDKTTMLDPAPIFVTADLTHLPVVLIGDPNNSKNVLDEIHQLRYLIQSVIPANDQVSYKRLSACYPPTINTCEKEFDRASPVNLSTSSRQTPSIRGVSPPQSVQMEPLETSQAASPVSSASLTPRKATRKPYRLDKAVRKLTDRLVAKKDEEKEATTPAPEPVDIPSKDQIENTPKPEPISKVTTPEPMIHTPLLNTEMLFANNLFNTSSAMPSPSFDNLTLMMLKNMTNQQLTSQLKQRKRSDTALSVEPSNGDDFEDNDKISNESSPTPSDSSNGKEYKNGYEKDSDKPYVCTQPNCTKRFANKFLLKKHQFIHTGQRPHICPHCSKCFNRKDNLLRHKKTHVANGTLNLDGRRRHHALLSPVTISMTKSYDPLNMFPISVLTSDDGNDGQSDEGSP
uniref:C2H2-type domain-containing protein n=1 Tax=Panagrellus redivivus TaxID=6233 RepID=A0A7E4VTV8_PANRE